MTLPEFIPIEVIYIQWKEVREVVESLTPSVLKFMPAPTSVAKVELDYRFMYAILSKAPDEYHEELVAHMNDVINTVADAIPTVRFEKYIFNNLDDRTLNMMNATLQFIDAERVYDGKPTTIQIMKHVFGLERYV